MLTARQMKVYQFIKSYMAKHGYAPTIAEIAKGIGIQSRSTVHRFLQAISEEGLIYITPNRRRNIVVVEEDGLRVMGKIAAGRAIEAIVDEQRLSVTQWFTGSDRYALRVSGDSMIGDNICDGDYIICEYRNRARNGEIVVALIDQQEATLKRIQHNPDQTITLIPSNSRLSPMVYAANRIEVQGIYVGLLRLA